MLVDLSLVQIMLRILAVVVLMGVHGFTLAALALVLGDRGPKYDGRLTPNPFAHFEIPALVSAVATRAGWISPMRLDPGQLRFGRLGLVLCVLASLALLVVFGWLVMLLRGPASGLVDPTRAYYVVMAMTTIADSAVWFAALNLLPLPPLTGGHLLAAVAPGPARFLFRHALWIGIALALVMLVTRGTWLQPLVAPLRPLIG